MCWGRPLPISPRGNGALAAAELKRSGGLGTRMIVGALLLALALAAIWQGGWAFTVLIALAIGCVFSEWTAMHRLGTAGRVVGLVALLAAILLTQWLMPMEALLLLAGAFLLLLLLPGRGWRSAGLFYAGLPAVALLWLRQQPDGMALVLWAMGMVWATDIFAYFAGRAIGGAKIWPAISPNKTWAGLIGGMTAAALFSALFGAWRGWPQGWLALALLGALLAVVAQAGDFFESWLKRRAGVKDSGHILPGHGGVMDRVDGLVPVAVVVALWVVLL